MNRETITLPRSVVEQALEALNATMATHGKREWIEAAKQQADATLRSALEQPQDHPEQHLDMVPTGWKLVPVEPTEDMLNAVAWPGCAATDWEHMLAAAPQPPVVEQPPVEQEPAIYPEEAFDMGLEAIPYYTHPQNLSCKSTQARLATLWGYVKPQPPRQPLTEETIYDLWDERFRSWICGESFEVIVKAIERAHGIGGEA